MTSAASLSLVPEAPSVPGDLSQLLHPLASAPAPASLSALSARSAAAAAAAPPTLPLPPSLQARHPTLVLRPYSPILPSLPSNVLALLHNAAKRDLADLVAVLIPSLRRPNPAPLPPTFRAWWAQLLRFLFFVADTNADIVALIVQPALNVLAAHRDFKAHSALHRQRKSIADRYDFAMEFVFRAADNALNDLFEHHSRPNSLRAADKLHVLVTFVLATLQLVADLADYVETIMPDFEIAGLEYAIPDNVAAFVKDDKPVLLYNCVRWMDADDQIKPWLTKFGGFWARLMFKSWQKMHAEQRLTIVDQLSEGSPPV